MSERPKSAGLLVRLLIAVAVLGLVFGGGVLVGWATRERRDLATEKSAASTSDAEVKREIAACRRELAARAKATAIPPATVTSPPGETDDARLEEAPKVEALKKGSSGGSVGPTDIEACVCAGAELDPSVVECPSKRNRIPTCSLRTRSRARRPRLGRDAPCGSGRLCALSCPSLRASVRRGAVDGAEGASGGVSGLG